MFHRKIIDELMRWSERETRKPLVLRGARQVGKTTAVNLFSRHFDQYIYLNLEKLSDSSYFKKYLNFDDLLNAVFLDKNMFRRGRRTLLFIDEIQESPEAIKQLRYFYEEAPDIYVIAAGSRLSIALKGGDGFPVGRVEFLTLHPVSFSEFLGALGENEALNQLFNIPVQDYAHEKLLKLFHTYALIGGMPEIVSLYAAQRDLTLLRPVYESLLSSFIEDVDIYTSNKAQVQQIRHAITSIFAEAGKRIRFEGFGHSNYRSREMGETLRKLEKAFLIYLVYPATQTTLPIIPDKRKSPRLQVLDTGMLNFYNGLQTEIIATEDLNKVYQGIITEHVVGQELLACQSGSLGAINFWVREKKESQAEVDYIYPYQGKLIPLEVKSGATGKLKSLHLYMEFTPHNLAVRLYPGKVTIDRIRSTTGKEFILLNLPYYLGSQIDQYLHWALSKTD
ncbi:MAG: ATP-binding protein [Bacteroidales bacterium]|nr:ATP-binding protein [Bacteroidales bacterium]